MKHIFYTLIGIFSIYFDTAFAITTRVATSTEKAKSSFWSDIWDMMLYVGQNIWNILMFVLIAWIMLRILRLTYEVLTTDRIVYMRITLPRADSKLDKEKETKKDFKEKIGIMTVFYKSIHNITQSSAWDTMMNFLFRHAKISFEIFFHDGQVHFYVA